MVALAGRKKPAFADGVLEQFFIKNCSGGRVQADARAVMSLKTAFFKRNEGSEAFEFEKI